MASGIGGLVLFLSVAGSLAEGGVLRFIVAGDNGGSKHYPYTTSNEILTGRRMAQIAEDRGAEFILLLGDNFYDDGVRNVHDHRFRDTFENVYTQKSLQIPWYVVAGNHDHHGNVSAQIAYSKMSSKWHFPDLYYPLTFKIPGSDATIDLVMIDTVTLCGHTHDEVMIQPTGPEDEDDAQDQWSFITNKLSSSKATYLWTAGHYPVYSIAEHGPTSCLVRGLLPLLYKYKANGHMCGHDHNLQFLQDNKNGHTLDFIVSGSAEKIDTSNAHRHSVPSGSSKFFWADRHTDGGFALVEVTAKEMVTTFIDSEGKVLYRAISHPRHV